MIVTDKNYFSLEAEQEYSTNSQRKTFLNCPSQWKSYIDGNYIPPDKDVFTQGTYVDMALTEPAWKFNEWKVENKAKMTTAYGKRIKAYDNLDLAIEIVRNEPLMMKYLKGQAQNILVIEDYEGVSLKMKLDCLNLEQNFLSDLKTCAGLYEDYWIEGESGFYKAPFYDKWDYWNQLALYQRGVKIVHNQLVDTFLVVTEKKPPFDRAVYNMTVQPHLDALFDEALVTFKEMQEIKDADTPADELERCGRCDYCAETKMLIEPEFIYPS